MKKEKVLSGERQQSILSILEKDGSVSVDELAKQFSVSGMTIRRDLKYLEEKNRIERFHGEPFCGMRCCIRRRKCRILRQKSVLPKRLWNLLKMPR